MKIPHFFKAKSRIGLKNRPIHSNKLNIGVEDGPDAILTPRFLSSLPRGRLASVNSFDFTKPEDIKKKEFNKVLVTEIKQFKEILKLARPERTCTERLQ